MLLTSLGRRVARALEPAEVPRRKLGRTGEQVSIIGLGGAHLGIQEREQESIRIIRSGLDAGINFLDNCWSYQKGESERRMGKALQGGYRDKAFLMTKVDGRTRALATQQLDQSLKRLRTDRIDLLQIHEVIHDSDPSAVFEAGGAIEALVEAKRAGKIRYVGFTGHKSPKLHKRMLQAALERDFRFDAVQMPLNLLDAHYDSFEKIVLPMLAEHEIGVLGMKPLLGNGSLVRLSGLRGVDCLHYALDLPTSVVITGCDSMKILHQALHAARSFKPLGSERRAALLARTAKLALDGEKERYKTTAAFDSTTQHPEWMR
jgi:predicted aldo/keto reductase-like oxidoreductase